MQSETGRYTNGAKGCSPFSSLPRTRVPPREFLGPILPGEYLVNTSTGVTPQNVSRISVSFTRYRREMAVGWGLEARGMNRYTAPHPHVFALLRHSLARSQRRFKASQMKHVETHSSRMHTEDRAERRRIQSLEIYSLAELIPSDFVRFSEERRIAC